MTTKQMKIDSELHKRLKIMAVKNEMQMIQLTNQIIKEYLDNEDNSDKK